MAAIAEDRLVELQRRLLGGYQLLQTLVGIRLRSVSDPESMRHLAWLSDVTAAMELISRRMTAEGPLDFTGYLNDVATFWTRACAGRPVRIEVRGQAALLPDSHLLPLAIVTHELIANACRHAFPDDRRGSIAVAFSRAVGGVSLVVRDSGVGACALRARLPRASRITTRAENGRRRSGARRRGVRRGSLQPQPARRIG